MRVLVVEDDDSIRGTLCSVIEMLGHTSFSAKSTEKALELLSPVNPDVIFLDLLMNGDVSTQFIQVAKDLMSAHPPRIVVISAMNGAQHVAERHHVEFIAKPFSLENVEAILNKKPETN